TVVHESGAGIRPARSARCGQRYLQLGRHTIHAVDRPSADRRKKNGGSSPQSSARRVAASSPGEVERAPRTGGRLPQSDGSLAVGTLFDGASIGGGCGALAGG